MHATYAFSTLHSDCDLDVMMFCPSHRPHKILAYKGYKNVSMFPQPLLKWMGWLFFDLYFHPWSHISLYTGLHFVSMESHDTTNRTQTVKFTHNKWHTTDNTNKYINKIFTFAPFALLYWTSNENTKHKLLLGYMHKSSKHVSFLKTL